MEKENSETGKIINRKRRFLTFFIFIIISSFFWLIIKLSNDYTVTFRYSITIVDVPVDKWLIENNKTELRTIVTTTGFNLLKNNYLKTNKRNLNVSLLTVPYRKLNKNNYYISTQNIIDQIANNLSVEEAAISLDETDIRFALEGQLSVDVPVIVRIKINYKKQYNQYGNIHVEPDFVKIYGSETVLDTIKAVYTEEIYLTEVSSNFTEQVKLDMNPTLINSDTQYVGVEIDVEKFTESSIDIPIIKSQNSNIKLFPESTKVYYLVALKDFDQINSNSFTIMADTTGISFQSRFLPLLPINSPPNSKIIRLDPKQVEYLIVK